MATGTVMSRWPRVVASAIPPESNYVTDAEYLQSADASFDYVLSAIGVMFTAGHQRAANELVRVRKPGGKIGLVSWTPRFISPVATRA